MKLIIALTLVTLMAFNIEKDKRYLGIQVSAIGNALNNHLKNWYPAIIDTVDGGYYTNLEYNWEIGPDQDKMLVTQARGLWTASKAASVFEDNKIFKVAADHGFRFLTTNMWDNHQGGFRLMYRPNNPDFEEDYKLIYGNAFALFALAEYAKINPSAEVLQWVEKTFDWIDSVAHDDELLGYYNLLPGEKMKSEIANNTSTYNKLSWGEPDWKDQNTSIHLLEAFTTVYQVLPLPEIKNRLSEMLVIVRDTMTQPNGSLKLYFTADWQPIDYSGSARETILEHQLIDHISFGHNIETAYLLIDAAKTLYGKADEKTLSVAKTLTDHTLQHGFGSGLYGLYDRGYDFEGNGTIEIIDRKKSWWAQFEAWHTLALMAEYYPEEKIYSEAFQKTWDYIGRELLDPKHGGYYNYGLDEAPKNNKNRKGHNWKGNYHDGRALILVWQYANRN